MYWETLPFRFGGGILKVTIMVEYIPTLMFLKNIMEFPMFSKTIMEFPTKGTLILVD